MENKGIKNQFVAKDYDNYDDALAAYERLKNRGYSDSEITYNMSEETKKRYNLKDHVGNEHPKANHAIEGSGIWSAVGVVVGAYIAAIAAIGTSLVLLGLGLIIARPIVAPFARAGAGAGGLAGGLIGAFAGMGVGDDEAKIYNKKVEDGNILVGVHSKDENEHTIVKNNVL